jgi:hypothetical protein
VTAPGGNPPVLPAPAVIHLIAFAGYPESVEFAELMAQRADRRRTGSACVTEVVSGDDFARAARARTELMLVSAHGPASELAPPVLGDGQGRRVVLGQLGLGSPFTFGALTGVIWDACYTGQPAFRRQLARLSDPAAGHIAPVGKICWNASEHMAGTIIDDLLAPGRPPVTAAAFTAAAARAAAESSIELWHGHPGKDLL